jgi:hypothetical protein
MFSNLLITNARNIVYELLLNLFAPVLLFLTICLLNNEHPKDVMNDMEFVRLVIILSVVMFVFPFLRNLTYLICILIIGAKLNTFISMKYQSEWDCRSAYDLFKKNFKMQ